jgi:hypothetical protein
MGRQRRGKAAPSPVLASRYALRRAFDPNRGLRPPPSAAPPLSPVDKDEGTKFDAVNGLDSEHQGH